MKRKVTDHRMSLKAVETASDTFHSRR